VVEESFPAAERLRKRSEFLLEHGQLDLVVERRDLKETLRRLLAFFADQPSDPPGRA